MQLNCRGEGGGRRLGRNDVVGGETQIQQACLMVTTPNATTVDLKGDELVGNKGDLKWEMDRLASGGHPPRFCACDGGRRGQRCSLGLALLSSSPKLWPRGNDGSTVQRSRPVLSRPDSLSISKVPQFDRRPRCSEARWRTSRIPTSRLNCTSSTCSRTPIVTHPLFRPV